MIFPRSLCWHSLWKEQGFPAEMHHRFQFESANCTPPHRVTSALGCCQKQGAGIPKDSCFHPPRGLSQLWVSLVWAVVSLILSWQGHPGVHQHNSQLQESPGLGFLPSWAHLHSLLSQTCCSSLAWLPQCSSCPSSSNSVKSAAATQSTQRDVTTDSESLKYTWNRAVMLDNPNPWLCDATHPSWRCSRASVPTVPTPETLLPTPGEPSAETSRVAPVLHQEQVYFYSTHLYVQKAALVPDKRRVSHLYRKIYCA